VNIIFTSDTASVSKKGSFETNCPKVCRADVVCGKNVAWVKTGDRVTVREDFSVESSILHPNLSLEVIRDAVVLMMMPETRKLSKTYYIDNGIVEVTFELTEPQ